MNLLQTLDEIQNKKLDNEQLNCITKTEWDQTETVWDPKFETTMEIRWDSTQILQHENPNCFTKTFWDPTKIVWEPKWDPKQETFKDTRWDPQ